MERMSGDIILIQEAMSEKVGSFIQLICTICGGFILAFVMDWILTLVMLSMMLPIGLCITAMFNYSIKNAICGQMANTEASEIVQQTVCSIRTVASFTGEKLSVKKYKVALRNVYRSSIHEGLSAGFGVGTISFLVFCSLSLGFWYGAKMMLDNGYNGGTIISIVFSIFMSMISLAPVSPCMATFAAGQVAAHKMFETINRKPRIDATDKNGKILDDIHGEIEFKNVDFCYPSRPEERIFKGLSLLIQSGATVALVGGSGSGKSTVISLIERFYDPQCGEVLIDSINIKQLQLRWLRGKIGHVSQEPVLFSSSIKDNIAFSKNDATIEEITSALELANASVFTNKFPQGLDTMVGEGGIKLSGGQKQRIALARAILKDPRILLLDEATSALDVESERVVQERLERVMMNCTTIIVAHRLSTVRNADSIAFMRRGKIVERGSHLELLKDPSGAYRQFIQSQEMNKNLNQPDNYDQEDAAISTAEETQLSQNTSVEYLHSRESSPAEPGLNTDIFRQGTRSDVPSKKSKKVPLGRLAYLNRPEIVFLLLGSVAAIANGVVFPIFGLLISSVIKTFFDPPENLNQDAVFWSKMFMAIGTISLVATPIRVYFFTVAGAKLIRRIRLMIFQKVVNMEIAWFDNLENSSGAIGARLSTDAAMMKNLVGDTLALLVQSITTLIAGLVLAFAASWELSLFILAFIPLIGLNGWMQTKLCTGLSDKTKKLYEEAGQVANDALGSIRTVASNSAEEKVMELYIKKYQGRIRVGVKLGVVNGIAFGFSFLLQICSYASIFYVGAQLVGNGKTTFEKVFQTFFVISLSSMEICRLGAQMPDLDKANSTTNSIFTILDHKSQIDSNKDSGITLENIEGNIEFKHVTFKYPTRQDVQILQDMCLAIQSGKAVALIGESGSGKSTVISLLQRFYDANSGKILLDGTEIQKFNLSWLRQQIGLVSQEPVLFNDTIWANIAYGKEGTVTEAEITAAAKSSNGHVFISSMKQGYQTVTGERGVQLSGGQKQRIAIARVIMKQPKILLLDEATSALDIRSEQIVQDALDNVMVNRTSIIVAHRLATIKNVDFIAVMKNGVIAEQGTHEALVNIKNGIYASMVALHSSVPL